MKPHWIEYTESWNHDCPMAFSVHRPVDGESWRDATTFDPPAPKPVPGMGFATYHVQFDGFTFRFSSLDELDVCIETLGRKLLPRTGNKFTRPEMHWLTKLPECVLDWTYREVAVKYLRQCRDTFVTETTG